MRLTTCWTSLTAALSAFTPRFQIPMFEPHTQSGGWSPSSTQSYGPTLKNFSGASKLNQRQVCQRPNNRLERSWAASSLTDEGVDDLDKSASFRGTTSPRRSTSSLCACAVSDGNELVEAGDVLMTITEYVLAFLLSANAPAPASRKQWQ